MYPSVSSANAAESLADLPPPPNPRPLPPSRLREVRYRHQRSSRGSSSASDGGAGEGRPFIDGLYAERVRGNRNTREMEPRDMASHVTPIRFQPLSASTQLNGEGANSDNDLDMEGPGASAELQSRHSRTHQPTRRYARTTGPFRRLARMRDSIRRGAGSELDLDFDEDRDESDDDDCPPEPRIEVAASEEHAMLGSDSTSRSADPTRSDYRWILPDPRERQREEDVRAMRAARSIAAGRTPAPHVTRSILSGYTPLPTWVQPARRADASPVSAGFYATIPTTAWSLPTPSSTTLSSSDRNPPIFSSSPASSSTLSGLSSSGSTGSDRIGARASAGYQPNSLYFPLESTPSDLLGLDWDDDSGTSLFIATEGRVWEWRVDAQARRSFGAWDLR